MAGIQAYQQGNLQLASERLQKVANQYGGNVDVFKILGICYFDQLNFGLAIQAFDKATRFSKTDSDIYFNLAICHTKLENHGKAIDNFKHCIALNPQHHKAHAAIADVYKICNHIDEAISSYATAIQLRCVYSPDLLFKLSQVLLVNGAWAEGFELFENRLLLDTASRLHTILPQWQGQPLLGKQILVECEQGFGDSIQFARYLNLLHDMGANITLACPLPLMRLFEHSFPMVKLLAPNAQIDPSPIDFYVPMMSLAVLFQTRVDAIHNNKPYLITPTEYQTKWKWLEETTNLKVGIVWSGNPNHKNDKNRSIAFERLIKGLPSHAHYFSIQKIEHALIPESSTNLTVLSSEIESFSDTAAICEQMDVVITVDTSIAHLCGALGVATWMMLPFSPDWRWLLKREDSVWYESVTLFRQPKAGDWDTVLHKINQQLLQLHT